MKAFLLAAGLGTRLRPLTERTPKCLLPIGGRPLLDIWLDALARAGVDEVLVNLHHHADQVQAHVATRLGGPLVRLSYEPELLGSAGTLRANRRWVADEEMFLAINADNLTDFDPAVLIEAHRANHSVATLTAFRAPRPSECGILDVDPTGRVRAFVEKPADPPSDLANAGVYAFHPGVLDLIGDQRPADIGYHLLPQLVGRAHAIEIDAYFLDIGTPAALERAQQEWQGAPA